MRENDVDLENLTPEAADRLRADTRRAMGGSGAAGTEAPQPGDLFVSPITARYDVEWLVAARRGDTLLAIPADSLLPEVGSGDLEVTEEDGSTGPLVLRCRAAAWVDAAAFPSAHRSGRLPARWAEAAHQRWRRLESGSHRGTPLEQETDADPVYRDRAEEMAAARDALLRHAVEGRHERQRDRFRPPGAAGSPPWLRIAAAVLLVALVAALAGALWWGGELRQRIAELSQPELLRRTTPDIPLGSQVRGSVYEVSNPADQDELLIPLFIDDELPRSERYRVSILTSEGREIWRREVELNPLDELLLTVPRSLAPPGRYTLRLEDAAAEPPRVLDEENLLVPPPD